MARKQKSDSAPLFRKELRSVDACLEVFRIDEEGYLSDAVQLAATHKRRESGPIPITIENAAHECGLALWKAIGAFNQHRLLHGGPDYEVVGPSQQSKTDPLNGDDVGQDAEENGIAAPRKIISRLRRSPTQHGKLRLLAAEAGKMADMIDELVAGINLAQRMGMIGEATRSIDVANERDRAKMRAILQEETALLKQDNGLRGIQHLLARMSEHKDRGGAPGHVFQQEFMKPLIPFWHGLSEEPPTRDDATFLAFVASAYGVFSIREFEGWESVLRTALRDYGKTSAQKTQGSD